MFYYLSPYTADGLLSGCLILLKKGNYIVPDEIHCFIKTVSLLIFPDPMNLVVLLILFYSVILVELKPNVLVCYEIELLLAKYLILWLK